MTTQLTIHSDMINSKINIVQGFEVDYNPALAGKDFNNRGTWGKVVNKGRIVLSLTFDPNKCEPNFGQSHYNVMLAYAKRQLANLQSLQPKQIESIINS